MGKAFLLGDDIDTDVLAPGRHMKKSPAELARHCLEAVRPEFAGMVRPGDYVVAGRNFGLGSSREQAAVSLKLLGVSAVLARSFARIFYRNAINLGLPVLALPDSASIADGDEIALDATTGHLINHSDRTTHDLEPLPAHLMAMIDDGGLIPHLKRRLARSGTPR